MKTIGFLKMNKKEKRNFVIWSKDTDQFLTDTQKDNWNECGYTEMYEYGKEDIFIDLNNFHKNALFSSKEHAEKALQRYLKKFPNMIEYDDYHCIEVTNTIVKKVVVEMRNHGKLNETKRR